MNYTMVGKMETFARDARHIFEATGINKVIPSSEMTLRIHHTVKNWDASSARTRRHFRTVNKSMIQRLYELY